MRYRIIAIVVSCGVLAASAQQEKTFTLAAVSAAMQKDAPVQVVGFRRGSKPNGFPTIVVKNVSDKTVVSVKMVTHHASPCSDQGVFVPSHEWYWPKQIVIKPGATAEVTGSVEHPESVSFAHDLTGQPTFARPVPFIHTEQGIASVSFEDGSDWHIPPETRGKFFTQSLLDDDRKNCSEYAANPDLSAIQHVMLSERVPSALPSATTDDNPVGTFFIRCRPTDGTTLHCPAY